MRKRKGNAFQLRYLMINALALCTTCIPLGILCHVDVWFGLRGQALIHNGNTQAQEPERIPPWLHEVMGHAKTAELVIHNPSKGQPRILHQETLSGVALEVLLNTFCAGLISDVKRPQHGCGLRTSNTFEWDPIYEIDFGTALKIHLADDLNFAYVHNGEKVDLSVSRTTHTALLSFFPKFTLPKKERVSCACF